ncbi:MAG: leucine-rich repeat protein [Lachnospiraceae bacterium]|nr:leucine-rich repeat protein [Lachnospiraceae bacterium]
MPVEGIASYYARFTESARNYTITFYAEDGTTVLGTQQVAYDTVPVYAGSAPTKAQDAQYTYAFDGWAATGLMDLNIYVDLPKVTGDVSYKAHFAQTARTYSVTLNLNAGEDAGAKINSGNVTEYTYGIGATLPTDVTRAGYEFKGWYEVSAPSTEDSQIRAIGNTETGDKTYYASWTPNPISGTIILTNSGTKLMVGETITASVTYTDGADNAGTLTYTWKRGDTVLTDETTASYTLVTADIGNKITCEIESSIETGKLTKSTETAVVERTFALSLGCANTDYGYIVATTSSGTTIENCTAASDAEVSGEVKPGDTVTLTLTCGKRDTTDYNDTVLNSFTVNGEAKNVTETNDQYVYSFTMPDEEVSVEAVFVTNDGYTASAVAATNGSVKLSTATNSASASLSGMKHNAAVTVTVTPEAGYELGTITVTRTHDTAWILLDSNEVALTTVTAGGEYTFTMPADPVNVAATFKPIDYEVMIDADKITNGTVTADQTTGLHVGDTVTLTTTSEAGYELETLSVALEDGTAVTHTPATSVAEATYTFTMPAGNVEVSAAFSKIVAGLYGAEGSIIKSWNRLLADGLVTVSGTKLTAVDHSLAGKLVLPVDIISINESTFQDCVSLTEIELTGVTALPSGGTSPFKGCSALKRLSMTKLATIPASTFANTTITSLETIELGEGLTSIGNEAFLGRESLKSIVIPDSVTSIGNYAFSGCKGLTTVTLGSGLKTIGKQAFLYCQSLEALVIPDSVTSLGSEQTFGFCTGLKSVTIGTGLTSLPQYAFDGCSSLEGTLVIPQNITSIGKGAFEGCEKLTGLTLSANLTSIGTLAFYNCKNIEGTITVPAGVTALSESQFKNCAKITSVKLPGIKTLSCSSGDSSNSPFGGCTALTSVEFGPDLTSIGAYVFNGRTSLTDVTFAGSEKKWADVTKGDYNTPLTSATKHFTAYLVNDGITNATAAATALEDWVEDENCYKPGASVTLTITPASGYTMTAGSLTLTDAAGNAITYEASASSDLVVTFTMPDSPVTVEAVFEETSSSYFSIGTAAHSNYDYYDYNSSSTIVVPGGTVVTDKTSAKAGETVKVTVTPDRGYVLNNMEISYYSEDSVIAETSRNILYSLVEGETTVYQFVVPSDVESTGWYAADIMVVANFEGTGNEVSCQYNTDYLSVTATAPSGFDNPKPSAPTISGRVNVVAGDEVTLNVTPGAGFAVDAITVTGSSGAPYEMTSPKEGTYVFTMPDEAVVVNTTTKLASADGKVTLPVSTDLSLIRKYLAVNGLRELVLTGTDDQELLELGSALEIPAGVTLTVGDGCILLVRDSAGILTVNGTLKTEGTGKVWLYGRAKLNAADGVVTGTVLYTSSATLTGEAESAILCAAIGSDSNGHVYYAVYDLEGGTYSALEVAATGAMPDTWWNFAPSISSHYSNSGCSVPWKACMTGGTKVKSLTLHKGITHIGKYAFYGLYYLEEVEVPSTVTEIADGAFKNCIVLKTIKLPEGLQSIGANAFLIEKEVTVTTEVNLPSTLVSIGNRAFYHRELLNVVIPKTLTDYNYGLYDYGDSYGYDACFSGAYLKDVSFESGTTAIPEGAFINVGYYKQLTFTIPVTVTEIGERPFGSSAPIIYYEGTKAQWLELIGSDTDLNATIIFTNNNLALASDLYGWDKIIGAGITQVEIIKSCSVSDSITVKSGMVMTIAEGVEAGIYASGDDCFTIEEGATIENRGKVTNAYNLLNNGTFNNYGTMINGGGDYSPRFTNSGTFNNSGTMTNEYGGEFTNSGILKNSATVTNDNGGTFNNNGTFTNSGTFTNNGTYTGSEVVVPVP